MRKIAFCFVLATVLATGAIACGEGEDRLAESVDALVAPPTSVTGRIHPLTMNVGDETNMRFTLNWNYTPQDPITRFEIYAKDRATSLCDNPADYNLLGTVNWGDPQTFTTNFVPAGDLIAYCYKITARGGTGEASYASHKFGITGVANAQLESCPGSDPCVSGQRVGYANPWRFEYAVGLTYVLPTAPVDPNPMTTTTTPALPPLNQRRTWRCGTSPFKCNEGATKIVIRVIRGLDIGPGAVVNL